MVNLFQLVPQVFDVHIHTALITLIAHPLGSFQQLQARKYPPGLLEQQFQHVKLGGRKLNRLVPERDRVPFWIKAQVP